VATGDHILKISKAGYRIWERNVRSLTGTVRINAELEATTVAGVVNPSPQVGSTRVDRQSASTASTPAPGVKSETGGAAPTSSTELNQETSIGVWFVGKPTVRHDGVEVSGVQQGGPAEELGIKAGDVILAIDEHYVFTIQELHTELRSHPDGSRVGIRYRRGSLIYENYIILKRKPG
jgi:C-terminal processing protease CtpA/Prc